MTNKTPARRRAPVGATMSAHLILAAAIGAMVSAAIVAIALAAATISRSPWAGLATVYLLIAIAVAAALCWESAIGPASGVFGATATRRPKRRSQKWPKSTGI